MQYANIIVNHRAGYEAFTYAIPPKLLAHLRVGSIVLVPIGRTQVHGTVTKFIRRVDETLAKKLKPIHSVVYSEPLVPEYLFRAVEDLHNRYGFGLETLLWPLLPSLPKREQKPPQFTVDTSGEYYLYEYVVSSNERIAIYQEMAERLTATGKSLLILCASQSAVTHLAKQLKTAGEAVTVYPASPTPKTRRDYFFAAPTKTGIILGTRGALITPLYTVGAMVVDEPWLPGHKEESAPRLWTGMVAQALAKARGIPLFFVSSVLWPETRMLGTPRSQTAKLPDSTLSLAPKRALSETLTQFFSQQEKKSQHAIILKESRRDIIWCSFCHKESMGLLCPTCNKETVTLPKLNRENIAELLDELGISTTIYTSEELMLYTCVDALLVLNFDAFLAVTDFRAPIYLATLINLIRSQAKTATLVTSQPDVWTPLIRMDDRAFTIQEMSVRREHNLPPFGLAVQLSAVQRDVLLKLIPFEWDNLLRASKPRFDNGRYVMSLLLKVGTPLPEAWFKNSLVKVDILPNYIQ